MKKIFIALVIIFLLIIVLTGGYLFTKYYLSQQASFEYLFAHPRIAKIFGVIPVCPMICSQDGVCGKDGKDYCNECIAFQHKAGYAHDGHCKVDPTAGWQTYTNSEYGFEIKFPDTWKGYSVEIENWTGHVINNYQKTYTGPEIVLKNPQTTTSQQWQDITIMVFTPDVWNLVNEEKIAVSAAPIGPGKIGENSKYIFATPPRWYGFTDASGIEEVLKMMNTFKAF